jgi:hypothetical protein
MRNNDERLGASIQKQDAAPLPQQMNQNPNQQGGLNFVALTEFVPLPSKGKFYPQHHPLHNRESIEIKQMTAKEEDILTSRSLLKKGIALDRLIESLILDKNINPSSLTVEDRNAIVVAARISAYGPEYNTSVTCPSCEQKVKYTFDLNQKIDNIENNNVQMQVDENGCFSFVLPSTKWVVVCRALNGYDEKAFTKLNENKGGNDSFLIEQLKSMIIKIQDVDDRATLDKAIQVLPAGDTKYLRKKYQEVVKGLDMKQNFSCSSCDFESEIEVPLTADFFWFK